jgi:hypothetical protein
LDSAGLEDFKRETSKQRDYVGLPFVLLEKMDELQAGVVSFTVLLIEI